MRATGVTGRPTATTISELVDDFLAAKQAKGLARKSVEQYRYALKSVFLPFLRQEGLTEPEQLEPRVLDRLSTHLLTQGTTGLTERPRGLLSKDTVHSYLRPVRWFCNWANRDPLDDRGGAGAHIPGRVQLPNLPSQRVVDVLSRDELEAMVKVAADRGPRDQLILEVLTSTGVRAGELARLRPIDLVRRDGGHYLRVAGKGDKWRLVPISPRLFRSLDTWGDRMKRQARTPEDAYLFMSLRRSRLVGDYEPLTPSGVLQLVKAVAEQAGIRRRVYVHLLRHSFATSWLQQEGSSPMLLKDILGHADLSMIDRHYGHLTHKDTYAAMLKYLRR